jgi:hypothetical protein
LPHSAGLPSGIDRGQSLPIAWETASMRLVVSGIAALTASIASHALATAETCGDRAQTCVEKWGNPKATCYEPFRISACEKTGRYVAPNGNVWPAIRVTRAGQD